MSSRERVPDKERRLASAGAVTVDIHDPDRTEARVAGDHGTYRVAWTPVDGWTCACPASTRTCSHVAAVRRVLSHPRTRTYGAAGGWWIGTDRRQR